MELSGHERAPVTKEVDGAIVGAVNAHARVLCVGVLGSVVSLFGVSALASQLSACGTASTDGVDAGFDAAFDAGPAAGLDAGPCEFEEGGAYCEHDCQCFPAGCDVARHCCRPTTRPIIGLCREGGGSSTECACLGGACDGPPGQSCCRMPDGRIPDDFGPECVPDAGP